MHNCLALLILLVSTSASAAPPTADLVGEARVLASLHAAKTTEKRLQQIVLDLGERAETPGARALAEMLADRLPQIMVPHEEGNTLVPFADVGAAARYTLRKWAQNAAYENARQATRSSDVRLLELYFGSDSTARPGVISAILQTPRDDLVIFRDAVSARINEPGGTELTAAFASVLADAGLYREILARGTPRVALGVLPDLAGQLGTDAAFAVLQTGLARRELASAALFAIGQLRPELPQADQLVWQLLTSPDHGSTAAAVLARDADRHAVQRLIRLLHETDDKVLKKRVVLALRLSGDPQGRQRANEWLANQP